MRMLRETLIGMLMRADCMGSEGSYALTIYLQRAYCKGSV